MACSGARRGRIARRGEGGFSLPEVLVGVAILGIILGPLVAFFVTSVRSTREAEDRIDLSADAQRLGNAWTRDVQMVEPGGVNVPQCPPAEDENSTTLVTFGWDLDGATVKRATWALVGVDTEMSIVRRYCDGEQLVRAEVLAKHFGRPGMSPAAWPVFGPSPAEPNNFCPADAHGIGRTCTINVGTSSAAPPSYSLTVARRAPDLNALSAPRPPGQPTVDCDDVDAVYARNQYAVISWAPPVVPPNQPPITGYTAVAYTNAIGSGSPASVTAVGATGTSARLESLVNGTTYYVGVRAVNDAGDGVLSTPRTI